MFMIEFFLILIALIIAYFMTDNCGDTFSHDLTIEIVGIMFVLGIILQLSFSPFDFGIMRLQAIIFLFLGMVLFAALIFFCAALSSRPFTSRAIKNIIMSSMSVVVASFICFIFVLVTGAMIKMQLALG